MKISSALFQCESQFVSNGRTLFEQNISDRALSRLSVDSAPPVSPSTRLVETRFISALRLETSFPGGSAVKASAWKVGDAGSIPGSGRSPGEGNGHPTPVLLPGESHGGRSLVGYSPWGCKESDTTQRLHFHFSDLNRAQGLFCAFLQAPFPLWTRQHILRSSQAGA